MTNKPIHWQPSASFETLRQRAETLALLRQFFTGRGYLEVETPIMGRYGITDVYLSNITATFRGEAFALQTSPEYPMKRLLAAGSGPIFQLARVFRDDELGRWHNPEFTLLEWYQPGIDHHELMREVDLLLQLILGCPAIVKCTYQDTFLQHVNIDPMTATVAQLQKIVKSYELDYVLPEDETDIDQYLFLLMSHVIEPALAKKNYPVAIYNFPPSQAALAKITNGFAERFEIYYQGIELANGFHELTDSEIQRQRLEKDQAMRKEKNLPIPAIDPFFLAALDHGLPICSGVALGIDRLLALRFNKESIDEILAFNFSII